MELGNDVINRIYEANYIEKSQNSMQIQRATSDCDTSLRETWIKHKYIEKTFVKPIDQLKNEKCENMNGLFNDIVFSENGWSVRQLRRKRVKLQVGAVDKHLSDDGCASSSDLPTETSQVNDVLNFESDSTDEEESMDHGIIEEKLDDFNSDMLLYKATAVHNLPVMSYALASGASKTWSNPNDLHRSPVHRAVLSVSFPTYRI